jgi:hypothetical protein
MPSYDLAPGHPAQPRLTRLFSCDVVVIVRLSLPPLLRAAGYCLHVNTMIKCVTTVKQILIVNTNRATMLSYSKQIRDNTDKTILAYDQTITDSTRSHAQSCSIQRAHEFPMLGNKFRPLRCPVDQSQDRATQEQLVKKKITLELSLENTLPVQQF